MDRFGTEELQELLADPGSPAISIYLPTHRPNDEADADRLRFRAAVELAKTLLADAPGDGAAATLLEDLEPWTREEEFWRHQADGLAVFRSPTLRRSYRLPIPFPEVVVVADAFHIRPLLRYLRDPGRYWVLDLARERTRLFGGSAAGLREVRPPALPRSMKEALGYEFERDAPVLIARKETAGAHGEHGRGGIQPVFHGHGIGVDDEEPELRRFFRKVDAAVREHVGGRPEPVILAAVEERQALYREVSELTPLAEEGIEASVRDWSPDRLHREAWPIARRAASRSVDRALEVWERALYLGKGEPDLAAVARQVAMGRVRALLLEEGRQVWGRLDRETGELEITQDGGAEPAPPATELLDELAGMVLARGGEVSTVPSGRMPTVTGAAAILW